MLEIKNLAFRYSGGAPLVLRDVSLTLKDGEIGILLAKNGEGKSTLFQTIFGLRKPLGGQILFDGQDLLKMNRRERARYVSYVPQEIRFGALSVFDTVLMGRISYFHLRAGREDEEAVRKILSDMEMEEYAGRNVLELSGGERQNEDGGQIQTEAPGRFDDLVVRFIPYGSRIAPICDSDPGTGGRHSFYSRPDAPDASGSFRERVDPVGIEPGRIAFSRRDADPI